MPMISSPNNYYLGTGIVRSYAAAKEISLWRTSEAVAVGDLRLNYDDTPAVGVLPFQLYECTTGGTTASSGDGPSGTGTGIADGGTVVWKSVAFEDRGDISDFTLAGESEELEHVSHREGVGKIDLTAEKKRTYSLNVTLEEITLENLALIGLGEIVTKGSKRYLKGGGAARPVICWNLEGTNDYGRKVQLIIGRCQLKPPKGMGFISEELATMETEGKVLAMRDGEFYYVAELD